jgi:uncharacterized protein
MGANATQVQQAYDAFAKGDIAAVIAMLDENVEWTSPRSLPHGGEFSGPAQVGKFFEGIGAAWDALPLEIASVDEVGNNRVLGVLRANGVRKGGKAQVYGAVHIFELENGKITRFREWIDA